MATFENVGLALQLVNNIHGLVRDMRDNASAYKAALIQGRTIAEVSNTMDNDANQYLRRIQWITDAVVRNQAGVVAALAALDLALSEANQLKNVLTTVANHTLMATLNTAAQINNEADYILSNVPDYERIY